VSRGRVRQLPNGASPRRTARSISRRRPDARSNHVKPSTFLEFVRLVVAGDADEVSRRLTARPALATMSSPVGASRQEAGTYFFTEIRHYLYTGDTALHMAAAAFRRPMAELLVSHGA